MKTINRTVVTIIPKKPYIDWANSFDDDGPKLYADTIHATSLLIPENYDEYNYELFMKINYKKIFEEELSSWKKTQMYGQRIETIINLKDGLKLFLQTRFLNSGKVQS